MLNFYDAMFIRSRLKWFDVVAEVERGRSALGAGGVAGTLAVLYLHLHVPLQQRHHKDWQPFRFLENYRLRVQDRPLLERYLYLLRWGRFARWNIATSHSSQTRASNPRLYEKQNVALPILTTQQPPRSRTDLRIRIYPSVRSLESPRQAFLVKHLG